MVTCSGVFKLIAGALWAVFSLSALQSLSPNIATSGAAICPSPIHCAALVWIGGLAHAAPMRCFGNALHLLSFLFTACRVSGKGG